MTLEEIAAQFAFLINASFNEPPEGKVWAPPIYAPDSAIKVYKEVEGGAYEPGEIVSVEFQYEDEDGSKKVRIQKYMIYDVSSEIYEEHPVFELISDAWQGQFPWFERIGLPGNASTTITSVSGYEDPATGGQLATPNGS